MTLYLYSVLFLLCAGLRWQQTVWVYSAHATKHLSWKVVFSQHFSEANFTSPECIRLNRMVVPTFCATSSHSRLAPKPTELTFPIPPMSSSSPLVACPNYLPVQKPIKPYSKLSVTASKTFSSTFPLAVLMKMLVVEHSGVLPQSTKQGILY